MFWWNLNSCFESCIIFEIYGLHKYESEHNKYGNKYEGDVWWIWNIYDNKYKKLKSILIYKEEQRKEDILLNMHQILILSPHYLI